MARPTKYTPETVAKLTQALELGATHAGEDGSLPISALHAEAAD